MNWYLEVLKKYTVFSGRARRKEYWMFFLFNMIIVVAMSLVDSLIGTFSTKAGIGLLGGLYSLSVLIPGIAVSVRRLHDTNRSGWWLLISLIPLIGGIVLLVFMVKDSQSSKNEYGSNPTKESAKEAAKESAKETARDGRFIAYRTVLDTRTNLMWAGKDNGSDIGWVNANAYCKNYRGGGYADWRMPTLDELAGLYDESKSQTIECMPSYQNHVATDLIHLTCHDQWTSETSESAAHCKDFITGRSFWGYQFCGTDCRVLPVRAGRRSWGYQCFDTLSRVLPVRAGK